MRSLIVATVAALAFAPFAGAASAKGPYRWIDGGLCVDAANRGVAASHCPRTTTCHRGITRACGADGFPLNRECRVAGEL